MGEKSNNINIDHPTLSSWLRPPKAGSAANVEYPASVYRMQVNHQFTLDHARAVLDYLSDLGVSAVYISPMYTAAPGSLHGYNVTDFNRINPEIGGEAALERFVDALHRRKMGLILDVVPNHMGIEGGSNRFWQDMLENGRASRWAPFFDVDWEPAKPELKDKVFLPVLGAHYGVLLEDGQIALKYEAGSFFVEYGGRRFPIAPDTYPMILNAAGSEPFADSAGDASEWRQILEVCRNLPPRNSDDRAAAVKRHEQKEALKHRLAQLSERSESCRSHLEKILELMNGRKGQPRSFDPLDALLDRQSYRLAYWRVGSEEINYRRFFDINELAAIRVEDPDVFEEYHRLLFDLIDRGWVQGLRIDHPDGLYDPAEYFKKIQTRYLEGALAQAAGLDPANVTEEIRQTAKQAVEDPERIKNPYLYVVVEKILDRREDLPPDWTVHGTVGYEYMNVLNGLYVRRESEKDLSGIYERFIGARMDAAQLIYEKKKYFAAFYMPSEINTLGHRLDSISEKIRRYRDFTLSNLTTALRETIACFPVYRSYIRSADLAASERDARFIQMATDRAKRKHPALDPAIFDFLRNVLLGRYEDFFSEDERRELRKFVLRFQQLTSPIMAKGVEDTVFYIYNRLISLNEVGGDPVHFGSTVEEFHEQNSHRQRHWPRSFITASTHDTKRSEDVRLRIDVLSELSGEWGDCVEEWSRICGHHKTILPDAVWPDRNAEYFIYQTLVGIWPRSIRTEGEWSAFANRIAAYLQKASREAKVMTNWLNPNVEYEAAVEKFVRGLLDPKTNGEFLSAFLPFQSKVSYLGALNAVSSAVLKGGSPGVVDCYQGSAVWDLSLVDPDNRRPVDYEARRRTLQTLKESAAGGQTGPASDPQTVEQEDGALKLWVHWKTLSYRDRHRELFLSGDYVPASFEGMRREHAVGYARLHEHETVWVLAGRWFGALTERGARQPTGPEIWGDTEAVLPASALDSRHSEMYDVLTGTRVPVRREAGSVRVRLSAAFERLPAAMLTTAP